MAASLTSRKAQLARAQKRIQVRARMIALRQKKQETEARIRQAREELKQL